MRSNNPYHRQGCLFLQQNQQEVLTSGFVGPKGIIFYIILFMPFGINKAVCGLAAKARALALFVPLEQTNDKISANLFCGIQHYSAELLHY